MDMAEKLSLCFYVSVSQFVVKNRVPLCLPLFSLWCSPPSESGTILRVNSAPSEGEDVSENVAAIPVCVGRSILLLPKE